MKQSKRQKERFNFNQLKAKNIKTKRKIIEEEFTVYPHLGSLSNDTRNNISYFKQIMEYPKYTYESYQTNYNQSLNDNHQQLVNESHNSKIINQTIHPIDLKSIISTEPTLTNINQSRTAITINKNRTLIPKISFEELDNYYQKLSLMNQYDQKTTASISPNHTTRNTEPSTHIKSTGKLKRISTRVCLMNMTMKNNDLENKGKHTAISSLTNDINDRNEIKTERKNRSQLIIPLEPSISLSKIIKKKNNNYQMPENLLSIKHRLRNQINDLADKCTQRIIPDNVIKDLEKTKTSEYSKGIIEKIKIVNNFLITQTNDKFISSKLRHRKVYVMIDGQVILSEKMIYGAYIEIPTLRYLDYLETKKEKMELYYEFLATCQKVFNKSLPFKNVFLLNGINVFDLSEIPEKEKAVYVSMSTIFRGVHLFNPKTINVTEGDYHLLNIKECTIADQKRKNNKFTTKRFFLRKKKNRKQQTMKKFKTILTKKKFIEDQSFTFGKDYEGLEKAEYILFSDDQKRCKKHEKEFSRKYHTLIDQVLYFNENEKNEKVRAIRKKEYRKLQMKMNERVDENTKEGLDKLIIKYNVDRGKKYNINMNHQKKLIEKQNQEEEFNDNTKGMGRQLLRQLRIFREFKDINIILDEKEFYKQERKKDPIETIINRNIKKVYNITPLADRDIQRYLPDLISLNIPRVLKSFPNLKRREFYDIFIQYKIQIMICVCLTHNLKLINKGIDFDTFFYCSPTMKAQGKEIAQKIYNTLNVLDMKYINWEEYMRGMLKMKSKSISDKIDMFFKVIDTDSNGLLSYEEVCDLSKSSLSRNLDASPNDEVIELLTTYFANLIFQLVNLPITEGIPFALIKEKIIEGKAAAGYLEMFICAETL